MKKKIVKKKTPKKSLKKAEATAKAWLSTAELRCIHIYTWQEMLDKMIAFGPNSELTPEEFMQGCIHAADMYVRNLWDARNG